MNTQNGIGEGSGAMHGSTADTERMMDKLLRTVDSKGQLMPSFLYTQWADECIRRGWGEAILLEKQYHWVRLTEAGWMEKQRRFCQ